MVKKKQVSFYVDAELWKLFSKICIDIEKPKTKLLEELIHRFVNKK
ncbi:MAG: hypothetical protein Q8R53_03865 [Nanoarchaeota archaeon]|nr:hypothetical protein [Nanoarchaeota archaeon]